MSGICYAQFSRAQLSSRQLTQVRAEIANALKPLITVNNSQQKTIDSLKVVTAAAKKYADSLLVISKNYTDIQVGAIPLTYEAYPGKGVKFLIDSVKKTATILPQVYWDNICKCVKNNY